MKRLNSLFTLIIVSCFLFSCKQAQTDSSADNSADLVIYGKIYTAENSNPCVESIAVKNGIYVYTGSRAGAASFIGSRTKVFDYSASGMIMPGCTEAHSHFLLDKLLVEMGCFKVSEEAGKDEMLAAIESAYNVAKAKGAQAIFGFGWNIMVLISSDQYPSLSEIDAKCPDIPLYFSDEEFHKAYLNSAALKQCGLVNEDGTVKKIIAGGEIKKDAQGKANGLLTEQAANFARINIPELNNLITKDMAKKALIETQKMLHNEGYVYYMDGWPNYFNTETFYQAAKELEANNSLYICIGLPYEFDSYVTDIDAEITKAKTLANKYNSKRINANYIKIFMDGTFAGRTAFTLNPYPDVAGNPPDPDHLYGLPNWEADKFGEVTNKANAAGLTMHVHTMGDAAVKRCVDAFASSGNKERRNTLVHVQNVQQSDFQRIKDYNICCAVGILWRGISDAARSMMSQYLPEGCKTSAYPLKSHLAKGTNVASSSDYPALSGAPWEPFKIMKIAVSGIFDNESTTPWDPTECCSREDMLKILTINGAYQMHLENERGSIKVGKYADFIYVDQDVFAKNSGGDYIVPDSKLKDTKIIKTYFEGK